ncbi:restriction endonuclease subunit S [Vibrio sp. Vb1574]|uniref:restriction endonuclease subunit S n=1 Tax=unclassified Vibrio TaxID=2614977 RepID=UPI0021D1A851|nr:MULTISPECIES: restriction endonuclease subunit S [unclassified Vibrio]MDE0544114.1 restriction endonuclease subunit S [Vibrio sp. VA3]MDW1889568.1 restriction endonuclease subunit S [Vibrio sp. Vb1574]
MAVENLITEHIDIWTSAIKTKSTSGRGSSKKLELYGVKKLRELILELAVRGKLVPQDANDEPVATLLKQNHIEQSRLTVEENLKTKASQSILDSEEYILVPETWGRIKLGNLAKFIDYRGKTPKKLSAGVRLITAKNVKFGYLSLQPEEFISEAEYKTWMTRGFPRIGDILFTPEAPLGNVAQVDLEEKFALAQRAICLQFHLSDISNYLRLFLMSPSFQNLLSEKATGTTAKGIKASVLKELVVYIPPIEEQHRIVAKVDELMALCDQLEQQTEDSIGAHQVLVTTLLDTLTNSADADELMQNWARISEHFDTLFTTEESIDQLKQTILQLAVMGKLVPQDPSDEPATELLKRIAEEKAQLVKEKKIKKQKALPPIAEDEKPFELPNGWEWCRFGTLINVKAELVRPEEFSYFDQVGPDSIEKGTGKLIKRRTVHESGVTGPNSRFYSGQILYSKIRPSLSKAIIAEFDGLCSADIYPLESMTNTSFLLNLILSEVFLEQVRAAENRIKMPKLNIDSLSNIIVPISPEQEMEKINSKLNKLISVCDALKQSLLERQDTKLLLTDAIIEQAV